MLVSITAENFFSFGRATTVQLNPDINLLVGINGSGKSNLIKAIRFLLESAVGEGMERLMLQEWGGFSNVGNFNGSLKDTIRVSYEFDKNAISSTLGSKGYDFQENPIYEVTIFKLGATGYYLKEKLYSKSTDGQKNPFIFMEMKNGQGIISTRENSKVGIQKYPQETKDISFKATELVLRQVSDPDRFYPLYSLRMALGKMMVYEYFDTTLKSPLRQPGAYGTEEMLVSNGQNLISVLTRIKNHHPLEFLKVEQFLQKVNPNFKDISFDPIGSKLLLVLIERGLAKSVSIEHISDGTLRFLILLSIMFNPERGGLLCLDEPEIGLHPDMINSVVETFRHASGKGSQLIVATHSPLLLNSLSLKHVLIFEKDNENQTVVSRKSEEDLIEWQEGFLAGQLWLQGQLGGTRW
jgi:predicted ATPase